MLEETEMLEDDEEQEEITHARSWDGLREKVVEIPLCGTKDYDSLFGFADDDEVTCPECWEILWGERGDGWVPPAGYA
jgi:hypothetical protein